MIVKWWKEADEPAPLICMVPEDSTYIVEDAGKAILCVSLYLTNCSLAYVENFVGNPQASGPLRQAATRALLAYIAQQASRRGYTRLICLAPNLKLRDYYKKIGFTQTADNLFSFSKEI